MESKTIYSVEFSTDFFIDPFLIQSFFESVLKEYNNPIRIKSITNRGDWLIYTTTLLTVSQDKLIREMVQDGLFVNFYKLK